MVEGAYGHSANARRMVGRVGGSSNALSGLAITERTDQVDTVTRLAR